MMPDPGEPFLPDPRHYQDFDEYMEALDEDIRITNDPAGAEAEQGLGEIESYLKEQANDG